jgi:hypothetical protein
MTDTGYGTLVGLRIQQLTSFNDWLEWAWVLRRITMNKSTRKAEKRESKALNN